MSQVAYTSEDLEEADAVDLYQLFTAYRSMAASLELLIDVRQQGKKHIEDPAIWFLKAKADYQACITVMIDINREAGKRKPSTPSELCAIQAILYMVHAEYSDSDSEKPTPPKP